MGATDFDFIRSSDLRACLDSDYREMQVALDAGAYKATLVLAGSLVEAVLCDYLMAHGRSGRGTKDPQTMVLAEMIDACHDLGILSDKNRDLCSVVRHYRNLIHPGRLTRLNEVADENSARVARSLMDIVVAEVSRASGAERGLTCEQLVKKIEGDPSSIAIMSHLLEPCRGQELERLLLDVLPARYRNAAMPGESADGLVEIKRAYRACYEVAFRKSLVRTKRAASAQVVAVVRQEPIGIVLDYGDAFLMADSLKYLGVRDRDTLKAHLLERLRTDRSEFMVRAASGVGQYLTEAEANRFGWFLARAVASGGMDALACQRLLISESKLMTANARQAILWQAQNVIDFCREHKQWERLSRSKALMQQLNPDWVDPDSPEDDDIPF